MAMSSFAVISHQLDEKLQAVNDNVKKDEIITAYLSERQAEFENGSRAGFDFPADMEWLNCQDPLSFQNKLNGKICVLDIFTYCCINCMHIIPDLKDLHSKFSIEDGLMIIGVHSAKFDNEKSTANVIQSILRYELDHPVINDVNGILYNALDIQCWPTLITLGPQGQLLYILHGEGKCEMLMRLVRLGLQYYRQLDLISHHSIPLNLERNKIKTVTLSFPGKVCANDEDRIIIADSGHHRILIVGKDGMTQTCIGSRDNFKSGFIDGTFENVFFNNPQGVACSRDGRTIFVADTNNHAIRLIDLRLRTVTTIAGTGNQGNDLIGGLDGKIQALNSPWDITLGPSPGNEDPESVLYIAMAGSHQIWALALEDCIWLKKRLLRRGSCLAFCGSGEEENRNNHYPHKASFAQPSGIVATDTNLYVADSESSTIRVIDIKTGRVKGLVGGGLDPKDLFSFGDIDGIGVAAKLQHPVGIAWRSRNKDLIVADTYNHKIKAVSPTDRTSHTMIDGREKKEPKNENDNILQNISLYEPSGLDLSPDGKLIYIANTNANTILVVNLETLESFTMEITFSDSISDSVIKNSNRLISETKPIVELDPICLPSDAYGEVMINITLPKQTHVTPGAKHKWNRIGEEENMDGASKISFGRLKGKFERNFEAITTYRIESTAASSNFTVKFDITAYYCDDLIGTCKIASSRLVLPITITAKEETTTARSIILEFII